MESKKEVDNTLPVTWWSSKLHNRIFGPPRNWIDCCELICKEIDVQETRDLPPTRRSRSIEMRIWCVESKGCKKANYFEKTVEAKIFRRSFFESTRLEPTLAICWSLIDIPEGGDPDECVAEKVVLRNPCTQWTCHLDGRHRIMFAAS
jgi:hypothetical protein